MNDMFNMNANAIGQSMYNSNIILVMSLEEAVMRSTRPGSDMVYFNQNGNTFYRVKVEYDGRKSYQEFTYMQPDTSVTTPATKSDLQAVLVRLEALENRFAEGTHND